MSAFYRYFYVFLRFEVYRLLRFCYGRSGTERNRKSYGHTVGNPAVDTAGTVGFGVKNAVFHPDRVVCLASEHFGKCKAVAEFHAFNRGYPEHRRRNFAFEPAEKRVADSCGKALDDTFYHSSHAIARGFRFEYLRLDRGNV